MQYYIEKQCFITSFFTPIHSSQKWCNITPITALYCIVASMNNVIWHCLILLCCAMSCYCTKVAFCGDHMWSFQNQFIQLFWVSFIKVIPECQRWNWYSQDDSVVARSRKRHQVNGTPAFCLSWDTIKSSFSSITSMEMADSHMAQIAHKLHWAYWRLDVFRSHRYPF